MIQSLLRAAGQHLAERLSRPRGYAGNRPTSSLTLLSRSVRPGDVLLVEGTSRFSEAVKYLSQSTWSHAALCIGSALPSSQLPDPTNPGTTLIEADVVDGVRVVPLSLYADVHTRVCRPVGLSNTEIESVIRFTTKRLGGQYDLKNVFDLARYLLPTPPVPQRWRRQMLSLGSGDPTRAICSSLIVQAFQSVHYPVLPIPEPPGEAIIPGRPRRLERYRRRHHSLFTPRDFDVSPYFQIVKPRLDAGFDPHELSWSDAATAPRAPASSGDG